MSRSLCKRRGLRRTWLLRKILEVNREDRQAEAEQLYEQFLAEFDGTTPYHALGIEQMLRGQAIRQLKEIRSHGLGRPAPVFAGVDLKGEPLTIIEYRGQVVLISFWATSCSPCMKFIPHEKALLSQYGANGLAIVGVNDDKDAADAQRAAEKHGVSWRSFRNRVEGQPLSERWHIAGYPTLYLLDRDGIVRRRWLGAPPAADLKSSIERLLAQPAAPQ